MSAVFTIEVVFFYGVGAFELVQIEKVDLAGFRSEDEIDLLLDNSVFHLVDRFCPFNAADIFYLE